MTDFEFLTSGQLAQGTIAEHRRRLKVLFDENEAGISPDTMLRSALLDADRVADELCATMQQPPGSESREASERMRCTGHLIHDPHIFCPVHDA